jgi:hypothetical protein
MAFKVEKCAKFWNFTIHDGIPSRKRKKTTACVFFPQVT